MQHSNGVNPFLDPSEQHCHQNQPADLYINPFGDDVAAQKEASAGTYINPFLEVPGSANTTTSHAYVNPFTDAPPPKVAEHSQPYANPFADSHTDAVMSSAGYVNPFEELTLHQQGSAAVHACIAATVNSALNSSDLSRCICYSSELVQTPQINISC